MINEMPSRVKVLLAVTVVLLVAGVISSMSDPLSLIFVAIDAAVAFSLIKRIKILYLVVAFCLLVLAVALLAVIVLSWPLYFENKVQLILFALNALVFLQVYLLWNRQTREWFGLVNHARVD